MNTVCLRALRLLLIVFVMIWFMAGHNYARCCSIHIIPLDIAADTIELKELLGDMYASLEAKDLTKAGELETKINTLLESGNVTDKKILSESNYLLGTYYLFLSSDNQKALGYLEKSERYSEEADIHDSRYAKCLNNLSIIWYSIGNYSKALRYGERSLEVKRILAVKDSLILFSNYLNLASINLQLYNFTTAKKYAESGLKLAESYPGQISRNNIASLYLDIAIGLYRQDESAKALLYAKQAMNHFDPDAVAGTSSWSQVITSITLILEELNMPEQAEEYYRLGLRYTNRNNIRVNYYLARNYADYLIDAGKLKEAEGVLIRYLEMIKSVTGINSQEYSVTNALYSSLLYMMDKKESEIDRNFDNSFQYLNSHPWDNNTKRYVYEEYVKTLYLAGKYNDAISAIDNVTGDQSAYNDQTDSLLNADRNLSYMIDLLAIKYKSLDALIDLNGDDELIFQAIETGRLLTSIFDNNRLIMSEDESRANLSLSSRTFYTGLIKNYYTLYAHTRDNKYLEKAFEMSEKSKASGFLAATRQVNAKRFSIPPAMADIDTDLRKKIGLYREFISKEEAVEIPDRNKIAIWEDEIFRFMRSRDSLIDVFESEYPDYYRLRYNQKTATADDFLKENTRKDNLLSYVMTENKLFLFIINRRYKEVIVKDIDPSFISQLERFRTIVSTYPDVDNAREKCQEYMTLAYELYKFLVEPVEPYLVGNKLTVSPDNILSYIPVEALITEPYFSNDVLYRDAPYLIKKYRVSYIYSATLSSETKDFNLLIRNRALAFAPSYNDREISDSILTQYPEIRGRISSLPYSRDEASAVVSMCGGTAYLNDSANEALFKREVSKYSIIHLAMHTLVNDQDPLYSKMIFSHSLQTDEDDMLNTYEVYNTPLNARMVVLSSCNTGSGKLTSGEGIQSLARGFIFSGGHSVVMSMWAVEDYAGSEVIKLFYSQILKGEAKSQALRKARLMFLENADQKRSHPYFWSTLVVYGDDSPLYYNNLKYVGLIASLLVAMALLFFIFYRLPRS